MATNNSNTKDQKQLRFATLIRVSTERQQDQGESLANQTKQNAQSVEQLGGTITREYRGQQHATAGHDQPLVDAMLLDAQKERKPFDAIIVADPTRWSRDNVKSATGLDILFRHGVRFFVGTSEYQLHDPTARLVLSQMASIGAFLAAQQTLKSMQSKITRAKAGKPSSGSLPWGRTYDKLTGEWGVDPEAKRLIETVAQRYLRGESLDLLAAETGIERSVLYDRLARADNCWLQTFRKDSLRINETISTPIPALLDSQTIKAVRKRMDTQRTFTRGKNVNHYLLAGKVFCEQCGLSLSPQSTNGCRYYRPAQACHCLGGSVRADDLEDSVVNQLFETMGNPSAVEAAMLASQPNLDRLDEHHQRVEKIDGQLAKIKKQRDRLLRDRDDDRLPEEEINAKLDVLRSDELKCLASRDHVQEQLSKMPTREEIRTMSRKLKMQRAIGARVADHTFPETWEAQRDLVTTAFNGTWDCDNSDGMVDTWPMGVFIGPVAGTEGRRPRPWVFTMRGQFAGELGGHTGLVNKSGSC